MLEFRKKKLQQEKMKFDVRESNADAFNQPVIPLVVESIESTKEMDKSKYISMDLKIRHNGPHSSTYKKYIKRFEGGTPQEFIDLLKSYDEIWHQNSITLGVD